MNTTDYEQLEAVYRKGLGLSYDPLNLPKKYPKIKHKIFKEFHKLTLYENGHIYQDDLYVGKLSPTAAPFKLLGLAINTAIIRYTNFEIFEKLDFEALLLGVLVNGRQLKDKIDYVNARLATTHYHIRRSGHRAILDFKAVETPI